MTDEQEPDGSQDPGTIETGSVANYEPNDPGQIEIDFVMKSAIPAHDHLLSEPDLHIADVGGHQADDGSSDGG